MDLTTPFIFNIAKIQWVYTPSGIVFPEKITKGQALLSNTLSKEQELSNNLIFSEPSQVIELTCTNGNVISIDTKTKVYTQRGWVEARDLKKTDLVLHKIITDNQNTNLGSLPINYIPKPGVNAMPIHVPKKNSSEFSEWIGIFLACGQFNLITGRFWIIHNDPRIIDRYSYLTEKIFRLKPIMTQNKREGRNPEYYIISKNVCRFLAESINLKKHMKKLPPFILEGSNKEQLALVKGMSAGSKIEKGYLIFYSGISKNIAECLSLILRNNGFIVSTYKMKNREKDRNQQDYYQVKILGQHPLNQYNICYQEELIKYLNEELNILVDIAPFFDQIQMKRYEQGYHTYLKMKKSGKTICNWKTATNFKIDMTKMLYYFCKISQIKTKNVSQVSLKVIYPEGFLLNNIVLGGKI